MGLGTAKDFRMALAPSPGVGVAGAVPVADGSGLPWVALSV